MAKRKKAAAASPLVFLSVKFVASAAPAGWQQLIDSVGMRRVGRALPAVMPTASFVALPTDERGMYLLGGFRRAKPIGNVDAGWTLELRRTPDGPPPPDVDLQSRAVGGYPHVLKKISDEWPAMDREFEAEVSMTREIAAGELLIEPPAASREISLPKATLKPVAATESFSTTGELGGIRNIAVVRVQDSFLVLLEGRRIVHIDDSLFTKLEHDLWESFRPLVRT